MAKPSTPASIDEYLATLSPQTREMVEELRSLIRAVLPGVTERISYGIPTFDLNGRCLVYAAGWKKHVALYPVTAAMTETFGDELKPYISGKGTLQFPLSQPRPTDLIRRIIEVRAAEVART